MVVVVGYIVVEFAREHKFNIVRRIQGDLIVPVIDCANFHDHSVVPRC